MNAVVDALHRAYGIRNIDMPATPLRIWEAIQAAKASVQGGAGRSAPASIGCRHDGDGNRPWQAMPVTVDAPGGEE